MSGQGQVQLRNTVMNCCSYSSCPAGTVLRLTVELTLPVYSSLLACGSSCRHDKQDNASINGLQSFARLGQSNRGLTRAKLLATVCNVLMYRPLSRAQVTSVSWQLFFRRCSSSVNPRNSPLTTEYECPRLCLFIITIVPQTNTIGQSPVVLSHAFIFRAWACFEHSNLLKAASSAPGPRQLARRPVVRHHEVYCIGERRTKPSWCVFFTTNMACNLTAGSLPSRSSCKSGAEPHIATRESMCSEINDVQRTDFGELNSGGHAPQADLELHHSEAHYNNARNLARKTSTAAP
jgi:hypothetical protein